MRLALSARHQLLPHFVTATRDRVAAAKQRQKRLVALLEEFPRALVVLAFRVIRRDRHKGREQARRDLVGT